MTAVSESDKDRPMMNRKFPAEAILFVCLAVATVIWRFVSIPWDLGGCFLHVWNVVVVTAACFAVAKRMQGSQRFLVDSLLIPAGLFAALGTVYFAAQVVLPVSGVIFVAMGVHFWCRSKLVRRIVVVAVLIPSMAYMVYFCLPHMKWITRIRHLAPDEIRQVQISSAESAQPIIIDDPKAVSRISRALQQTSPYSPNREGVSQKRELTIYLADGSAIRATIGKGNKAYSDTVWMEDGIAVYQNPVLYEVFQQVLPGLWPSDP